MQREPIVDCLCGAKVVQGEMLKHMASDSAGHLVVLAKQNQDLKADVARMRAELVAEMNNKSAAHVASVKAEVAQMRGDICTTLRTNNATLVLSHSDALYSLDVSWTFEWHGLKGLESGVFSFAGTLWRFSVHKDDAGSSLGVFISEMGRRSVEVELRVDLECITTSQMERGTVTHRFMANESFGWQQMIPLVDRATYTLHAHLEHKDAPKEAAAKKAKKM